MINNEREIFNRVVELTIRKRGILSHTEMVGFGFVGSKSGSQRWRKKHLKKLEKATGIKQTEKGKKTRAEKKIKDKQVGGSHYDQMAISPIDYILANNLGFTEGNIIKYVSRYQSKNGVEDLLKARQYLEILIGELADD